MSFTRLCSLALAITVMPVGIACAQLPPAPYVAPAPILNPNTSMVVPLLRQVPVSHSLGGSSGGVFGNGQYLRGTNRVVNPSRSVMRGSHVRPIVTRSARRSPRRASRSARVGVRPGGRWADLRHLGVALGRNFRPR